MKAVVKYEDVGEKLVVKLSPAKPIGVGKWEADHRKRPFTFTHMDVSINGTYVSSCQFITMAHAQIVARLLVGIEIQPDGAAWKRGPRGKAVPTDAKGERVET